MDLLLDGKRKCDFHLPYKPTSCEAINTYPRNDIPNIEMIRQRKIIHVDMDAFFASVEQRDQPAFRGKPLIVGGQPDSRGVVAACSYEARVFGIHSAMPCSQAYRRCPDAIFVPPRFAAYREVSDKIREIFWRYASQVEPLSLDEAYLDVTYTASFDGSATRIAQAIKQEILAETKLVASAGVSYNKFLAKIASDMDKPDGLYVIKPEQGAAFVATLPVLRLALFPSFCADLFEVKQKDLSHAESGFSFS